MKAFTSYFEGGRIYRAAAHSILDEISFDYPSVKVDKLESKNLLFFHLKFRITGPEYLLPHLRRRISREARVLCD